MKSTDESLNKQPKFGAASPLVLRSRAGTMACVLKNSMMPPYKNPRLPFGESWPMLHDLLQPLKVAHTLMEKQLSHISKNLPGLFHRAFVIYRPEIEFPDEETTYYQGEMWLDDGAQSPCTADGFCFHDTNNRILAYSFDFNLLDFSTIRFASCADIGGLNLDQIEIISSAASFYNESVKLLFDIGWLIFPIDFVDSLSLAADIFGQPNGAKPLAF